jgi:hypothetical protein
MAESKLLQDWLTVRGNGNTIVQDEAYWLEVEDFQDMATHLQVATTAPGTLASTLYIQTSPTKDDAFFDASASASTPGALSTFSLGTMVGVFPVSFAYWSTMASQALGRYLRWKLTFPAAATTVTFRIWVTLNRAG